MTAERPSTLPRQPRYLPAGTWDRERVIDACRQWAAQTGAPPTRDARSALERLRPGAKPVLAVSTNPRLLRDRRAGVQQLG